MTTLAVCAGVFLFSASRVDAALSVSSQTVRMMSDLESLRDVGSGQRGQGQLNRFFDTNHARPGIYPHTPPVFAGQRPSQPIVRNPYPHTPPVFNNYRLPPVHSGRSLSAISAEKKARDAQRVSQIMSERAWGHQGYRPGYPYPGYGYPGYGYPRYQPTLGDRLVDGTRSFFNHLEAGINNIRHNFARFVEPQYPYVTRYQKIPTYYGDIELPVYRYRHAAYDIPGYGHIPGYRPGYPGFPGNYPPRWDHGNFYGYIPGYDWRQGYGYIPEQVFSSAFSGQYKFVPQTRGGGTIERVAPGN